MWIDGDYGGVPLMEEEMEGEGFSPPTASKASMEEVAFPQDLGDLYGGGPYEERVRAPSPISREAISPLTSIYFLFLGAS